MLFHLQDGISFEKCPCLEVLHLVLFMGNADPQDTSTQWGYGTKLLSTAHGHLNQLIIGIQTRIGQHTSDENILSRENDVPWRTLDAAIVLRPGLRVQFQRRVEEGRPGRFVSPEERIVFGPAWVWFLQRMLPSREVTEYIYGVADINCVTADTSLFARKFNKCYIVLFAG